VGYSVQERAECLGTFRWVEVRLMEMLARWIPTTPEMELKILFGRHVWDCAQHADAFGKRAFELRAPLNYTLPAVAAYEALIAEAAELEASGDRVDIFYDVLCTGIADRYRAYVADTDALMDEPTVRIVENALRDHDRMRSERARLVAEASQLTAVERPSDWLARERSLRQIVAHGEGKRAPGVRA